MPSKPITRSAELDDEAAAARDETWKAEYDRHLSSWREESAVRREAAEKEREKWEKVKQGQGNRSLVTGGSEGGHGMEARNVGRFQMLINVSLTLSAFLNWRI